MIFLTYPAYTYRSYISKNYPPALNSDFIGGVYGCPKMYVSTGPDEHDENCTKKCKQCFDKLIPIDAVDSLTGKRIYPDDGLDDLSDF